MHTALAAHSRPNSTEVEMVRCVRVNTGLAWYGLSGTPLRNLGHSPPKEKRGLVDVREVLNCSIYQYALGLDAGLEGLPG
jgi:hypothetical protein